MRLLPVLLAVLGPPQMLAAVAPLAKLIPAVFAARGVSNEDRNQWWRIHGATLAQILHNFCDACHKPSMNIEENYGGESGIRTHVTLSSKHAFQACAFSHSAISPGFRRNTSEPEQVNSTREESSLSGNFDSMALYCEPQPAAQAVQAENKNLHSAKSDPT